jgi:predicted phosphodiesterase
MRKSLLLVGVLLLGVGACSSSDSAPETTTATAATAGMTTTSGATTTGVATSIAPPPPVEPIRVAVIGDFGIGTTAEYEVAALIEAMATDQAIHALVTTGDNFYNDDIDTIWSEPYGWVDEAGVTIYPAWGNHDIETQDRVDLVNRNLRPAFWWYSTKLGEATLIVVDSNQVDSDEQLSWLEDTLAVSDGLVIVAFHHPAFACGKHGSTGSVIERWVPLFEEYGVDLVLNGHEHSFERFSVAGVTYIVTGGAGQGLRPIGTCPEGTPGSLKSDAEHQHYVLLEIDDQAIEATTIAVGGTIIDRTVITDR